MNKNEERRRQFKTPRITLENEGGSQELRRQRALEEQKRKRLELIDSSRQLEIFAGLQLGPDEDDIDEPLVVREGIAQFTSFLPPEQTEDLPPESRTPSPAIGQDSSEIKKNKKKGKHKRVANPWANKCMYAELLEMSDDPQFTESWSTDTQGSYHDGIPDDLESGWVALAPVPVGKRCLAVTMQSSGLGSVAPRTMLRSRLVGKVLLPPFPSHLPPNTVLDCILDYNWKANGILHILDVLRWKGQDMTGCEASFRFWWRDTRLHELPTWPSPPQHDFSGSDSNATSSKSSGYRFPYPTTFIPVPYTTPTTYEQLLTDVIPRSRNGRSVCIEIPLLLMNNNGVEASCQTGEDGMQVDNTLESLDQFTHLAMRETDLHIASDGILLYVSEAMYESGESPLCAWIPRKRLGENSPDLPMQLALSQSYTLAEPKVIGDESPLDLFERLIRRRAVEKRDMIPIDQETT